LTDKLDIVNAWIAATNENRIDEGVLLFSEDASHDEVPADVVYTGREGIADAYKKTLIGFPDMWTEVTNSVDADDGVCVEVVWTGTHKGEFRGLRATGKTYRLRGVMIFKFKSDRIHHVTEYYDSAQFSKQIF
jgi:steroid delta-isomerase-like uncharacterized protein